jgi:UDP-N-acetylglucosamine 2-epimerase (non-hydrolysing)
MVVIGTRPEAIKLAPVVRALTSSPRFTPHVVVTGQHREMVDQMLALFDVTPNADLNLMAHGQTLSDIAARVVTSVGALVKEVSPAAVIVQGDTTTAMASALAAFHERVPVAHVEAGLRTGDRYSPFPEEVNRRLITQLSTLHLAPTPTAVDNLLAEGVTPTTIRLTGNTVVDALLWAVDMRSAYEGDAAHRLEALDRDRRKVLLVTAHRRESWESGLARIARAVDELVRRHRNLVVVFPAHRNPLVRREMLPHLGGSERVIVTEPLHYGSFARLLKRADLILTDSGGIQEEGATLGKPTLVARDVTERPEGLKANGIRLVGTDPDRIVRDVSALLDDPAAYERLVCTSMPFGDGRAAARVVEALDDVSASVGSATASVGRRAL